MGMFASQGIASRHYVLPKVQFKPLSSMNSRQTAPKHLCAISYVVIASFSSQNSGRNFNCALNDFYPCCAFSSNRRRCRMGSV